MILDEATASVDADNESHIQAALSALVLQEGEIRERGTHKELMEEQGIYQGMVTRRSQLRGFRNQERSQGVIMSQT